MVEAEKPSAPQKQYEVIVRNEGLFSPRQTDILKLLVQGKSVKDICQELHLGKSTVNNHTNGFSRSGKRDDATTRSELGLQGIAKKIGGVRVNSNHLMILVFLQYGILELVPVENEEEIGDNTSNGRF